MISRPNSYKKANIDKLNINLDGYNHDILSLQRLYMSTKNYHMEFFDRYPDEQLRRKLKESTERCSHTISLRTNRRVPSSFLGHENGSVPRATDEVDVQQFEELSISNHQFNKTFRKAFPKSLEKSLMNDSEDVTEIKKTIRTSPSTEHILKRLFRKSTTLERRERRKFNEEDDETKRDEESNLDENDVVDRKLDSNENKLKPRMARKFMQNRRFYGDIATFIEPTPMEKKKVKQTNNSIPPATG